MPDTPDPQRWGGVIHPFADEPVEATAHSITTMLKRLAHDVPARFRAVPPPPRHFIKIEVLISYLPEYELEVPDA